MKIYAVTNDRFNLSDDIQYAKFCKVFHLSNWEITGEEYIENDLRDSSVSLVHDEADNILLVKKCNTSSNKKNSADCRIVVSEHELITNAVRYYLEECKRIESNYCCNP